MQALWLLWACAQAPEAPPEPLLPEVPRQEPKAHKPAALEPLPVPVPQHSASEYAATHVLLSFEGAVGAPEQTRTYAEARAEADALLAKARAGTPLEDLAREHSDGPTAARGGSVGVFLAGTMEPAFERAVASVEPGDLVVLVESPYGVHLVRRDAVERIGASHLVVSWEGCERSAATRNREEALARIALAQQALAEGTDFATVARTYSDGPTARSGGELGAFTRGSMVPAFEEAAFALDVGAVSDVVETPYGLHLILRTR